MKPSHYAAEFMPRPRTIPLWAAVCAGGLLFIAGVSTGVFYTKNYYESLRESERMAPKIAWSCKRVKKYCTEASRMCTALHQGEG